VDRGLYVAMSGAKQLLQAQASNANNLANSNTPGFRADLEQQRTMPLFGPGQPSRVYALTERPGHDFKPGALQQTGRTLDVAIDGNGWLAVQTRDGKEAYTRAGNLEITPEGALVTESGLPVLGNGGPIVLQPYQKLEIGTDGTLSVLALGANPTEMAAVDQIKRVNPDNTDLEKGTDGLMHLKPGATPPANADVKLVSGFIEGSNVNNIEEMVQMIQLARHFENQIKVMKTLDDNSQASSDIMRMG
jgi:flagellar basal-body rod protein FlgF